MDHPNRPDEEEFERRWEELANQLSAEIGAAAGRADPANDDEAALASAPPDEGAGWVPGPDAHEYGPRDWEPADEPDEHYVPPEPEPLSRSEPLLVLAWSAVGVALLGLAVLTVFHIAVHWTITRGLVVLLLAAFGVLIWRMPHRRENPDDPGARV